MRVLNLVSLYLLVQWKTLLPHIPNKELHGWLLLGRLHRISFYIILSPVLIHVTNQFTRNNRLHLPVVLAGQFSLFHSTSYPSLCQPPLLLLTYHQYSGGCGHISPLSYGIGFLCHNLVPLKWTFFLNQNKWILVVLFQSQQTRCVKSAPSEICVNDVVLVYLSWTLSNFH